MSRAPYSRGKPKKEEMEEPPVIRMENVSATEEEKRHSEPTAATLIPPSDATDIHLRLQGTPEKTLSLETVEHKGEEELLSHIGNPDAKLPVIRGVQPPTVTEKPVATVTFTKPAVTDEIKLGPGDALLWREAVRPDKKGDGK